MSLATLTGHWVQIAALGWPVALALLLQIAAFVLLKRTGRQFRRVTAGQAVFDLQNRLSAAQIHAQLPAYTAQSRRLYRRFFLIDFFFPLFASAFLSLLWAGLLSRSDLPAYQGLLAWHVPWLAFVPALFDWCENLCFATLIQRYPRQMPRLARSAILCKRIKLATLFAALGFTVLLLGTAIFRWGHSLL